MLLTAAWALLAPASPAAAHDDIAGSVPADLSVIDDPIDSVEIDFGVAISDDVVMFLVYDVGDGTLDDIGGETVKTGDTTAELRFDELEREGTYTVRFLAPVPADAHVIQGSIGFTYGEPTGLVPDDPNLLQVSPPSRSLLDETVSSARLVFIDDVEVSSIRLTHDGGDGETFTDVDVEFEQVDGRTVAVEFEPLEREGTYFLAYEADSVTTGEEFAGASSFSVGRRSGTSESGDFPVVPFTMAAVVILALGALGTLALARRAAFGDDDIDPDGPDGDGEPTSPDDLVADDVGAPGADEGGPTA